VNATPEGAMPESRRTAAFPADWRGDARLGRVFVELADTLVAEYDVLDFLYLLCDRCSELLAVDAVGVLLVNSEGELSLSAASTEEMRVLELFELQQGEGPCYDAFVTGEVVVEADIVEAGERWPRFSPEALRAGLRSVSGFPLRLRNDVIGALNMFRREPTAFDEDERIVARALADAATIGIMHERIVREAELRSKQLQHALDSRVVVEQAKGILAERLGVDPGEAFERLRRYARSNRMRIHAVCEDVIAGRLAID
jgi:GAF domain-containing protein